MRGGRASNLALTRDCDHAHAMKVLVVEDELKMASLLLRGFRSNGHAADVTRTGEDAVWMAVATRYDAIVLDVMLPGIDGFETLARLREQGRWPPVLMLTARDAVKDRIAGLDVGADDYLTKPFSFAELLARLRAIARRGGIERPTELAVGDLRVDPAARRARGGGGGGSPSPEGVRAVGGVLGRPGPGASRGPL